MEERITMQLKGSKPQEVGRCILTVQRVVLVLAPCS